MNRLDRILYECGLAFGYTLGVLLVASVVILVVAAVVSIKY